MARTIVDILAVLICAVVLSPPVVYIADSSRLPLGAPPLLAIGVFASASLLTLLLIRLALMED